MSIVKSGDYQNAIISTKGNLQRTNPEGIVESLGGGYDLSVEAWENTKIKDGSQDLIAVTLREASTKTSGGGILFSNNWNTTKTIPQLIDIGEINVRSGSTTTTTSTKTERVANGVDLFTGTEAKFTSYPNPFRQKMTAEFSVKQDEAYTLDVYDVKGSLVKRLQTGNAKAGQVIQATWEPERPAQGVYIIRLVTPSRVQHLRVVQE